MTDLGPNRVRLILTPAEPSESQEVDLVVSLGHDEFGFDLLH